MLAFSKFTFEFSKYCFKRFLLNDFFRNEVWFKGLNFLTLPESGWPHFTIGHKVNFDLSKKEEKLRLIQFITKTVLYVYSALL